jgi:hypothetical protein
MRIKKQGICSNTFLTFLTFLLLFSVPAMSQAGQLKICTEGASADLVGFAYADFASRNDGPSVTKSAVKDYLTTSSQIATPTKVDGRTTNALPEGLKRILTRKDVTVTRKGRVLTSTAAKKLLENDPDGFRISSIPGEGIRDCILVVYGDKPAESLDSTLANRARADQFMALPRATR